MRKAPSRVVRAATTLGLCCSVLATAPSARANGRYPSAQQLLVDPSDPSRLWLRATYGVLTSPNAGKSWSWICERAIGYAPGEDPMMVVASDGAVLAATALGLIVTRDAGCTWEPAAEIGERFVLDVAIEGDRAHVLAMTSVVQKSGAYDLVVWRSADSAGRGFQPLGGPIASDVVGMTLDPAPSAPERLYVTGIVIPQQPIAALADGGLANVPAVLLRSRDGGATWERRSIQGTNYETWPLIAAVDPTNPDALYVRVRGPSKARGSLIESWLLYSEDAGDTWREIFRGDADMLGFSLSDDGRRVFVGLGDSRDPSNQRAVSLDAVGIYRAERPEFTFTRALRGNIGCLTASDSGMLICGSHVSERFEVGLSTDDGDTATALLDFGPTIAPLECPAGTSAARCIQDWPTSCSSLRACPPSSDAGALRNDARAPTARGISGGCGVAEREPGSTAIVALAAGLAALLRARRATRQSWTKSRST